MKKHLIPLALTSLLPITSMADTATMPVLQAPAPAATAQPAMTMPATQPITAPAAVPATVPATAPAAPVTTPDMINCSYHIPKTTTTIDQSVLETWASKAAIQSFQFVPATMSEELTALQACYTDLGWQGFNDALKKSGNLDAIRTKQLTVSSEVMGKVTVESTKDNQWKAMIPLNVTYLNKDQKVTQSLNVELMLTRKPSGDLGIMQLIALPNKTN